MKRSTTSKRQWERKLKMKCAFCGGKFCLRCSETCALKQKNGAVRGLHANWITDQILAMMRPSDRLFKKYSIPDWFKEQGIDAIINLTVPGEHPFCGDGLVESGFPYTPELLMNIGVVHYNFGFEDMTVPEMRVMLDIVRVGSSVLRSGGKIAVHCHAGYGRTGIVIACLLVHLNKMPATEAIAMVRGKRPGSVQTPAQKDFVHRFEAFTEDIRVIFNDPQHQVTLAQFLARQAFILHHSEHHPVLRWVPRPVQLCVDSLINLAKRSPSNVAAALSGVREPPLMEYSAPLNKPGTFSTPKRITVRSPSLNQTCQHRPDPSENSNTSRSLKLEINAEDKAVLKTTGRESSSSPSLAIDGKSPKPSLKCSKEDSTPSSPARKRGLSNENGERLLLPPPFRHSEDASLKGTGPTDDNLNSELKNEDENERFSLIPGNLMQRSSSDCGPIFPDEDKFPLISRHLPHTSLEHEEESVTLRESQCRVPLLKHLDRATSMRFMVPNIVFAASTKSRLEDFSPLDLVNRARQLLRCLELTEWTADHEKLIARMKNAVNREDWTLWKEMLRESENTDSKLDPRIPAQLLYDWLDQLKQPIFPGDLLEEYIILKGKTVTNLFPYISSVSDIPSLQKIGKGCSRTAEAIISILREVQSVPEYVYKRACLRVGICLFGLTSRHPDIINDRDLTDIGSLRPPSPASSRRRHSSVSALGSKEYKDANNTSETHDSDDESEEDKVGMTVETNMFSKYTQFPEGKLKSMGVAAFLNSIRDLRLAHSLIEALIDDWEPEKSLVPSPYAPCKNHLNSRVSKNVSPAKQGSNPSFVNTSSDEEKDGDLFSSVEHARPVKTRLVKVRSLGNRQSSRSLGDLEVHAQFREVADGALAPVAQKKQEVSSENNVAEEVLASGEEQPQNSLSLPAELASTQPHASQTPEEVPKHAPYWQHGAIFSSENKNPPPQIAIDPSQPSRMPNKTSSRTLLPSITHPSEASTKKIFEEQNLDLKKWSTDH